MAQPKRPERTATRTVLEHPHIAVLEHEVEDASGARRRIVTLDLFDWAVVAATDARGRFVLVEQHRHGIDAPTLEVAGGVVDPGEDAEAAARRELLEETGYEATSLEPLGWVHPNPALHGNKAFFFLARGAVQRGAPENAEGEDTHVRLVDASELDAAGAEGRVSHAMTVMALDRARRALGAIGTSIPAGEVLDELEAVRALEATRRLELASRLRAGLTADDLQQPHDFPELADPDFQRADGLVAGVDAALLAVRALAKRRFG